MHNFIQILSNDIVILEIDCTEDIYYKNIKKFIEELVFEYNKVEKKIGNKMPNIYLYDDVIEGCERTVCNSYCGSGTIDLIYLFVYIIKKKIEKHQAFVYPMINNNIIEKQKINLVKELVVR